MCHNFCLDHPLRVFNLTDFFFFIIIFFKFLWKKELKLGHEIWLPYYEKSFDILDH